MDTRSADRLVLAELAGFMNEASCCFGDWNAEWCMILEGVMDKVRSIVPEEEWPDPTVGMLIRMQEHPE